MTLITVRTRFGLALKIFSGKRRKVNRLEGVKEKKGFVRFFLRVLIQKIETLLQKDHVDFFVIEVGRYQSRPTVERPFVPRELCFINNLSRRHGNAVTIDEGVKPIACRATSRAEKMIEPAMNRRIRNRSRKVDTSHRLHPEVRLDGAIRFLWRLLVVDHLTVFIQKRQTDVPLPEHRGFVTLVPQHFGKGQAIFGDQARAAHAGEHTWISKAKCHLSRQDAVSGRSADGAGAVSIREPHSFPGHAIEVRRGDL